jgi:dTDP-4-dehydrorhamnose 3,5-epimerase
VLYKQDTYYEPDIDRAFKYDDPDVGIEWPLPAGELVPSQRDLDAPLLRDVADGLPFEYR